MRARQIVQRIQSYVFYRVAMTLDIMFVVIMSYVFFGFQPLTAIMIVALALLDDIPIMTIGYDTPWRQVHALLLQAAERTSGLRHEPHPVVYQTGLEDFYVKYTLAVCLRSPAERLVVFVALHGNILDLFNEHGVQIMSPHYFMDPATQKIVPKKEWFAAPAAPDATAGQ